MTHSISAHNLDKTAYEKLLRTFAYEQGADDALHDVLERLLKKPRTVHDGYVGSAVRNASHDMWRKSATRSRYEREFAEQGSYVDERSPLDHLIAESLKETLAQAVKTMPVVDQSIFEFRYVAGLPVRQIAQGLGLHVSSVEKRMAKIKQHIADRLADMRE